MRTIRPAFLTLAFSLSLIPCGVHAQWQLDGATVSTALSDQVNPAIVSDGAGGAFLAWNDFRSGAAYDIYAQRLSVSGVPQWTADGVVVSTAASDQVAAAIALDGSGGVIITWFDYRSGSPDIYVQRVNASGVPLWTANGVAICTAPAEQYYPKVVSDAAGGAIITWQDYRSGTADIYAQRVNTFGVPQWTANGVALSTAANQQLGPTIVSDGAGGAIVTWYDSRTGPADIYARRVNASGVPQWTADGVIICNAAAEQYSPAITSDGAGGAIITWYDYRYGANSDIFVQRVNASGVPQWTANGVSLVTAGNDQRGQTIVSDGAGGAIVAWQDNRSGTNNDIYAQRVTASGSPQWANQGLALSTAANDQSDPAIVTDGAGGAIVTWHDLRSLTTYDIYAQRVSASGFPQWTADGVALSTAAGSQLYPAIVSNGAGGAIVTWADYRTGSTDVYAQRVEGRYGYWGRPEPGITSVADIRNDQGGKVKVNWAASSRDVADMRTITHYSMWRATDVQAVASAESQDAVIKSPSSIARDFQGRAVWVDRHATADYYWEWVGNQDAHYRPAYTFSTATRSDSTSQGISSHQFFVSAHTSNEFVFFDSNAMSGHSVDNLAPTPPLMLTAQRAGSDVNLRWSRVRVPDLRDYSIYRATSTGVTPVPVNFLSSADDTILVDANAPTSALYYIVTAYDVHENQSVPSNEAGVSSLTGAGNLPPITALTVLQNHPNPFSGRTDFEIGLPAASDVAIEIFDVAGRRARQMSLTRQAKGWRSISFDGLDDRGRPLASGVYFYKVKANGTVITRKMVIAR